MHTVISTPTFLAQAKRAGLSEDEIQEICSTLAKAPVGGNLISGTGGARKMRHAGRSKGKSGGYRTIHFFGGEDIPLFLLAIYSKGEKGNISRAEKNELSALLPQIAAAYREDTAK